MQAKTDSDRDANAISTTTLLIGLGTGGAALLPYLVANEQFRLVGACDTSPEAIGMSMARMCGIPCFEDPVEAIAALQPELVIDATGDPSLPSVLNDVRAAGTSVVTGEASRLLWELLAALEGRRRSDLRYDRILRDMNSGVVVVQNERIRFVNPSFLKLFRYTTEEILGRPFGKIVAPDMRERDVAYHCTRATGQYAPEQYETHILDADGGIHEVMVRARLSEWDGKPACIVIMADVSTLRELQRERERFFRFMVHELRAPLAPLVTALALLKLPRVKDDPERYAATVGILERSATRLQTFIDDFLDLSKLDNETLAIKQDTVDVNAEIDAVVESQSLLAEDKDLDMRRIPQDPFPVRGDALLIRTIAQNLINNAIKYTESGTVTVEVTRGDERFTLRVTDTGPGLTEEERANLFQEYGRIKRMAGVKGTGLGLALVKKLVDVAGGEVAVTSPGKGHGSTFSVALPYIFGVPAKSC